MTLLTEPATPAGTVLKAYCHYIRTAPARFGRTGVISAEIFLIFAAGFVGNGEFDFPLPDKRANDVRHQVVYRQPAFEMLLDFGAGPRRAAENQQVLFAAGDGRGDFGAVVERCPENTAFVFEFRLGQTGVFHRAVHGGNAAVPVLGDVYHLKRVCEERVSGVRGDFPQLCLLYTSPRRRDAPESRMPSSA